MNFIPLSGAHASPAPDFFAAPSYLSTIILFGPGTVRLLAGECASLMRRLGRTRPVLVVGGRSPAKTWQAPAIGSLAGLDAVVIEHPGTNPTIEAVARMAGTARAAKADFVIGIGGGSVLDVAKTIAASISDRRPLAELVVSGAKDFAAAPIVAVPTTAGSGSEVSTSATVWNMREKTKLSLSGPALAPALAVVDPDLCGTLPPRLAAATGLDALAHAVESVWSRSATPESQAFGLGAIARVARHLEARVKNPRNAVHREAISRASLEAGISMAVGKTTVAHAISYPLTARYGIHHGHACALSLGALLRFNAAVAESDCADPRGIGHARRTLRRIFAALGVADGADGERKLHRLIRSVGLATFDELVGIDRDLVVADAIVNERFHNNPRAMTRAQADALIRSIAHPPIAANSRAPEEKT